MEWIRNGVPNAGLKFDLQHFAVEENLVHELVCNFEE